MQVNDQLILPFSLAHQKNEEEKVQRKIKERRKRKENLTSFLFIKWRKEDQKKLMLHTCQTHTHRYVSPNSVDHKARVCQAEKKLLEHMQH